MDTVFVRNACSMFLNRFPQLPFFSVKAIGFVDGWFNRFLHTLPSVPGKPCLISQVPSFEEDFTFHKVYMLIKRSLVENRYMDFHSCLGVRSQQNNSSYDFLCILFDINLFVTKIHIFSSTKKQTLKTIACCRNQSDLFDVD